MPRPSKMQYIRLLLRYGFSFAALKSIIYLFAYYIVNHVVGLSRVHKQRGVRIRPTAFLREAQNIYLGKETAINHLCCLWAGRTPKGRIVIGDRVMFGPGVKIFGFNQSVKLGSPMLYQEYEEKGVTIGSNVWIGANVIIVAGVSIGNGCVIGAGSVVTRDIPPNSIAVGIPAKVIKQRE